MESKADGVQLTAAEYQDLLDRLDRAEAVVGIHRGLRSMRRGEGQPAEKVLEEIRAELRARRRNT